MENGEFSNANAESMSQQRSDFLSESNQDTGQVVEQVEGQPTQQALSNEQIVQEPNTGNEEYAIDERYKDLPQGEATLRTLKSKYDILYEKNVKMAKEIEDNAKYAGFVNEIMDDRQAFEAFVNQIDPNLIPKKDFSQVLQEKLNDEFPEFAEEKPTMELANANPGGKEWLYFKKLDEYYAELKGENTTSFQNLKEFRAHREKQRAEAEEKYQKEIAAAQKAMGYNDEQMAASMKLAKEQTLLSFLKMQQALSRIGVMPNVTSIPGANTQQSKRQAFLDSI